MNYDEATIKKELTAINEAHKSKGVYADTFTPETVEVTSQEADFIEQVLYKQTFPLTARQASFALDIIERYQR